MVKNIMVLYTGVYLMVFWKCLFEVRTCVVTWRQRFGNHSGTSEYIVLTDSVDM